MSSAPRPVPIRKRSTWSCWPRELSLLELLASDKATGAHNEEGASNTSAVAAVWTRWRNARLMFFLPRQAALAVLAIVGIAIALLALGAPRAVFAATSWVVFMVLVTAVVSDLYQGPKR